jgi:FtsP/CotA-like multicopper oxidase with cupredoxin domain
MTTATADRRERNKRTFTIAGLVLAAVLIGGFTVWAVGRIGAQGDDAAATTATGLRGLPVDLGGNDTPQPTGQVKEYNLRVTETSWELAPGVSTNALTFNGTVPGPTIRVTEGDTVRVTVTNESAEPTSVHWHGLHLPNAMDGVPPFTQDPINPGESFIYEFPAPHAGTFMYHSHLNAVEQVDRGLYGLLIIDPQTPGATEFDQEFTMMLSAWAVDSSMPASAPGMDGGDMTGGAMPSTTTSAMNMDYNYFTINGKAFPLNDRWTVREGDVVRVRIANISNLAHPMHLHGADFKVVAKDGEPLPPAQQQVMNTVTVNAGETYDIVILADNPGTWVFHCHELHHTENNGVEPGGLIQVIQYEGAESQPASEPSMPASTPTPMPEDMPGMDNTPGMDNMPGMEQ